MTHMVFEQALWGALAVGREKERELASTSLEFEFLHQKSRCEMLIGGDDISSDVINLGTCFSMSVYIRARFCFALTGGNLTVQSTGSHRGAPWRACSQAMTHNKPAKFHCSSAGAHPVWVYFGCI